VLLFNNKICKCKYASQLNVLKLGHVQLHLAGVWW